MWRCFGQAFESRALHEAVSDGGLHSLARPRTIRRGAHPPCWSHRHHATKASFAPTTTEKSESSGQRGSTTAAKAERIDERLLAPTAPSLATLAECSNEELITALKVIRDPQGWQLHGSQELDRHSRITQFVAFLLDERGLRLGPFIYECMMDAMADPRGSAQGVRDLMRDMDWHGIQPTAVLCQSALDSLMIHPDYELRQAILDKMQEFWFPVDARAKQSILLGMLRDEQYELAYERLTQMREHGERVEPWVYDIFILVFGRLGFLDEMLSLRDWRRNAGPEQPLMAGLLLYYVLDVCSEAFHHAGTAAAWGEVSKRSAVQPSDGIVGNVLATAARHGDAELATEALNVLARRGRVQPHQYEAVVEAFARSTDVAGALRILCIMQRDGATIDHRHTRVVLDVLKQHPELVDEAEAALWRLNEDHSVPSAAAGVVLEAMAAVEGSERATTLFGQMEALCGQAPGAHQLQNMMMHSRTATARRAFMEEYARRVPVDEDGRRSVTTYETLVPLCLEAEEVGLALRFAHQLAKRRLRHAPRWLERLVRQAAAQEDGRMWEFVERLKESGSETALRVVRDTMLQIARGRRAEGLAREDREGAAAAAAAAAAERREGMETAAAGVARETRGGEAERALADDADITPRLY